MAKKNSDPPRTEPAHSFLYAPASLPAPSRAVDTATLLKQVTRSLDSPFNQRQEQAFGKAFTDRISLLWGPPGTGKTTVLAGVILGWLEDAWAKGRPASIAVGSSNYNAIDKVLTDLANLLDHRTKRVGKSPLPVHLVRLRSDSAQPPVDGRLRDVERDSVKAQQLAEAIVSHQDCFIVGATWMQLSKLASAISEDRKPVACWFDLLVIDEASQVPVASAAAYYLLLKDTANVVLAGDPRQLGPIYGFAFRDTGNGLFDCIFTYLRDTHGIKPVALDRNYRTNDEISGWPRLRFYREGYEAFQPKRRLQVALPEGGGRPANWPAQLPWTNEYLRILDPDIPVTVITYDAQTYTLSNPFEAQMVAALTYLYRRLLEEGGDYPGHGEFWKEMLSIVTPHRAQMSTIRNLLVDAAGMPMNPPPFVDTVDRVQGQERDLVVASYTVADRDFVRSEEEFILNPRRFNVTLTRARCKFVMFVSNSIVQHLPSDIHVARDAAHLQLFVEDYCCSVDERVDLPFIDNGTQVAMPCRYRGRRDAVPAT